MEVEIYQILQAREQRAERQKQLLSAYPVPLICFTMNIAGPVKNSDLIREGFRLGKNLLLRQLTRKRYPVLYSEESSQVTGCEAFFSVQADAAELKKLTAEIEEFSAPGRLFDMDVILPSGKKVERTEMNLPERKCLICGQPGKACARSRAHTVSELKKKTQEILSSAVNHADASQAAAFAVRSLLYEVCVTPKPGLVDRCNSGSHTDMDIFSFMSSCSVLYPYFEKCCVIGRETAGESPKQSLAKLRWYGKEAEASMLRATGGVNTHKGAIFSLGILCGALGRMPHSAWSSTEAILTECEKMAEGLTDMDFSAVTAENAVTIGQRLYAQYRITGVRGQVEQGFPAVRDFGLPVLEQGIQQGLSLDRAGAGALLAMLCHTEDTNLISRSSPEDALLLSSQIENLLNEQCFPDVQVLSSLDELFIKRNLSPGGTADLLAVSFFLYFLKSCEEEW